MFPRKVAKLLFIIGALLHEFKLPRIPQIMCPSGLFSHAAEFKIKDQMSVLFKIECYVTVWNKLNSHCYSFGYCFALKSGYATFNVMFKTWTLERNSGELNSWQLLNVHFVELLQLLLLTFKQGLKSSTTASSVANLNVAFVLKLLIRLCARFCVIIF